MPTTNELLKKAQDAHYRYQLAIKTQAPLDMTLYWSKQYTNAYQELKHHTRWSLTRLYTEITGETK